MKAELISFIESQKETRITDPLSAYEQLLAFIADLVVPPGTNMTVAEAKACGLPFRNLLLHQSNHYQRTNHVWRINDPAPSRDSSAVLCFHCGDKLSLNTEQRFTTEPID